MSTNDASSSINPTSKLQDLLGDKSLTNWKLLCKLLHEFIKDEPYPQYMLQYNYPVDLMCQQVGDEYLPVGKILNSEEGAGPWPVINMLYLPGGVILKAKKPSKLEFYSPKY